MFRTRVLSAAVFVPLFIVLMAAGGWLYTLALLVILIASGVEYAFALRTGGFRPYITILLVSIAAMLGAQALGWMPNALGPGLALLLLICAAGLISAYGRDNTHALENFGLTIGGVMYIGWLGAHMLAIRQLADGVGWTLIAVLATGLGDMGAYFAGHWFGQHKMSPVVSPHKTWEGYWGGVAMSAFVGAVVAAAVAGSAPTIHIVNGLIVGIAVGIFSPIGDLTMSVIKRVVGIKNFSNLLPGHGGMLDRMDSLLVGITIAYYLIVLMLLAGI